MKLVTANKIKRLWEKGIVAKMVSKSRVLKTMDEVEANTNEENVVGALVGKQLINNLAQQPEWVYDSTGKITGYKTQNGGAGTVFPFNRKMLSVNVNKPSSSTATIEVTLPNVDPNANINQIFPVVTAVSVYNVPVGTNAAKAVPSVSNFTGSKVTVSGLFSNSSAGANFYFNVKIVYPSK